MRNAFIKSLMAAAERDERIWLLTGDLGYSVLEPFEKRFPDRYINVGICEQTMTGIAAGLAMAGKKVVTYSIANFPTLRCLEQIRNDVCYHGLDVKIVAVGGGMAYGSLGYTHHAVEDLAIMRSLPGIAVAAPGDPLEADSCARAALAHTGPAYIRLGKAGEAAVHSGELVMGIGDAFPVRSGSDMTLVSTGAVLPLVLEAADRLSGFGISAAVVSAPWISPISDSAVELASAHGPVVTVEEHVGGGLFSALSEAFADRDLSVRIRSVRLFAEPSHVGGSQSYLRAQSGVSVERVVSTALRLLEHSALPAAA